MSRKLILLTIFIISTLTLNADLPWNDAYQQLLLKKVGEKLPEISDYPAFQYPNKDHDEARAAGNGKILLFGYGSLMTPDIEVNKKSIKPENMKTLRPAIAFGVKRLFNRGTVSKTLTSTKLYRNNLKNREFGKKDPQNFRSERATIAEGQGASENGNSEVNLTTPKTDSSGCFGINPKERCFLNLVPTTNLNCVTNGVIIDVDQEDLTKLIAREVGYDLVPLFVASWEDAIEERDEIKIEIAYTFLASGELRDHVSYTSNDLYPIRRYASVVDQAARFHGLLFWKTYQKTTWLADGTTLITDWHDTFDTPLNTKE